MMSLAWHQIEPLLMQVEKPARYVGGEFNQVVKPGARVRGCLAFPDLYELGMSYHGFRILYERINAREGWSAERAYAPWPDFEALLRERALPLYSLETRTPLAEFDWLGFTLQHEVNFTNLLNMLDLAGLPLETAARDARHPLVIAGGHGGFNPEPLAPFLDAVVLGDGEEAIDEVIALVEHSKAQAWNRPRLLAALSRLPGLYIPSFYEHHYDDNGLLAGIAAAPTAPAGFDPAAPIVKRQYSVARDLGSVRPVVPLLRTVHDRLAIEIRRGCVNGCRFCQAGMITRPVVERPLEQIVEIARQGIENTGYDEISLLSLSSADYTLITPLVKRMTDELGPDGVSISMPSLRINAFDVRLVDEIARVRKSGFTFAPEAGSTRLRNVINKPVDQENFFQVIEEVFRRGWRTVKFYFMIGLPTETDADLDGIVEICQRAADLGRRIHGKNAAINVTLSPFVPKPSTPFQWEAQPPRAEVERRYFYVRDRVRRACGKLVSIRTANPEPALIEAVLALGDRRVAAALRRAVELGARFDGWDEQFSFARWEAAFAQTGIDPSFYANRQREPEEPLPWDLLDAGLGKRFLAADLKRSRREAVVEKCDTGVCPGCKVCGDDFTHTLAEPAAAAPRSRVGKALARAAQSEPAPPPSIDVEPTIEPEIALDATPVLAPGNELESKQELCGGDGSAPGAPRPWRRGEAPRVSPSPVQRLRMHYTKHEGLRFLSHLDFAKVLSLMLRRARVPIAWSQGFNPMPRVSYAPPISLGMGGDREPVDFLLTEPWTPAELARRMQAVAPPGFTVLEVAELPLRGGESIDASVGAIAYRAWPLPDSVSPDGAWTADDVRRALREFEAATEWPVEIQKPKGRRTIDLKRSLREIAIDEETGAAEAADGPMLRLIIEHAPGLSIKAHEALGGLLRRPMALGQHVAIHRTALLTTQEATCLRALAC